MELYRVAEGEKGLSREEIESCLLASLEGRRLRRVLIKLVENPDGIDG